MSFVGKPFWKDPTVRRAQQKRAVCQVCGDKAHLLPIDPDVALSITQAQFLVDRQDLLSHRRFERLVVARAFAVWMLRSLGRPMSYPQIGRIIGGRDHATIINLHQKAVALRLTNTAFRLACAQVEGRYLAMREHRNV